jgi:hypothetical protein
MSAFSDLLDSLHVEYRTEGHEHCRPGWIQFDCPFCSRGWRHFRMGYNLHGRYVNCWSCSRHGLDETLRELSGLSWRDVRALVGNLPRQLSSRPSRRGKLAFPAGLGELLPPHEAYLRGRGFDPEVISKVWGVRGIGIAPRLQWSLFIPVVYRGEVVSWTTRAIGEKVGRRYRSAADDKEAMNHRELLYGGDLVRGSVIVHEGPTDVWRTGPGAVATMGQAFTPGQVRRLSRIPRRVICYDNSAEAQERARALADALMVFPGSTVNVVLDAKDAAEASAHEIEQLRRMIA